MAATDLSEGLTKRGRRNWSARSAGLERGHDAKAYALRSKGPWIGGARIVPTTRRPDLAAVMALVGKELRQVHQKGNARPMP
jgi:hypothetical protein